MSATTPSIMVRLWLQTADGPQPAVLLDPAHPALQALEAARAGGHADMQETALQVAAVLEASGLPDAATRAEFIRRQCAGDQADGVFDAHRARWGIPDYREDLVLAGDFRHGFLWRFRDHGTSSSHNYQAKTWYLCSPEARYVQHYDFEGDLEGEGPYKTLVERDVAWGLPGEISVLDAPVFTLDDYRRFGSDPAFAKAQEALQWTLRDAHEAAREDYRKHFPELLILLPPEAEVVCDLARLSLYRGAAAQAQAYLEQALELDRGLWEAWYYLGITCSVTGQRDRAAAAFRQAAACSLARERDPHHPWYRVDLVTDQLRIYGQAIQRLGAAALETIVPARPPSPPEASEF